MAVMELLPERGVEVTSPQIPYNTHEREYSFHWFNTVVRLYGDASKDYAKYFDDGEHKVWLPDKLQEELLEAKFPFSFFPTPAVEKNWYRSQGLSDEYLKDRYELMNIKHNDVHYTLRWNNTVMRVFGESEHNHLEVKKGNETRGLFANETIWEHLFENEFPIIYLPTIEMDGTTKKWLDSQGKIDKGTEA